MWRMIAVVGLALGVGSAAPSFAQDACKPGELVIKFSHVAQSPATQREILQRGLPSV